MALKTKINMKLTPLIKRIQPTQPILSMLKTDGSVSLAIYIFVWSLLFYLIPDLFIGWLNPYTNAVMKIIPSISVYANNSPDANRVAAFWSIQWSLCPIYLLWASRKYRHLRAVRYFSFMKWAGWMLAALILCCLPVYFPYQINIDSHGIRSSDLWDRSMHDMYWPNALMAIIVPVFETVFLFSTYLLAKGTKPFSLFLNRN